MATENTARTASGRIVSDKMDKTITVLIERRVKHPLYGKYVSKSSRIKAHDENNEGQTGDVVTIQETRPMSKTKSWKLLSIDEKASGI